MQTNFKTFTNKDFSSINAVVVGDTFAPLLAVVPYLGVNENFGGEVSFSPTHLAYHPLRDRHISQIEIEIRTRRGKYVPFSNAGESVIVVHIRQCPPNF